MNGDLSNLKRLSRNKILFGVCSGFANFFGMNLLFVRLMFLLIPFGLAVYIILAAILPEEYSLY